MSGENNGENSNKELNEEKKSQAIQIKKSQEINSATFNKDPIEIVKDRMQKIKQLYDEVLVKDLHYGIVPGTDKPSLLKPGAEKILNMFTWNAEFPSIERIDHPNGHREYIVTCQLLDMYGNKIGQGVGSCSTLESKYRWRTEAGEPVRPVEKDYWNAKENNDKAKMKQIAGGLRASKTENGWYFCKAGERKENPDIADQYNTVLKMAKKRSVVDTVLTVGGVSDRFTQDIEENETAETPAETKRKAEENKTTPPQSSKPDEQERLKTYQKAYDKCCFVPGLKEVICKEKSALKFSSLPIETINEIINTPIETLQVMYPIVSKEDVAENTEEFSMIKKDGAFSYLIKKIKTGVFSAIKKTSEGAIVTTYKIEDRRCDCTAGQMGRVCKHVKWCDELILKQKKSEG